MGRPTENTSSNNATDHSSQRHQGQMKHGTSKPTLDEITIKLAGRNNQNYESAKQKISSSSSISRQQQSKKQFFNNREPLMPSKSQPTVQGQLAIPPMKISRPSQNSGFIQIANNNKINKTATDNPTYVRQATPITIKANPRQAAPSGRNEVLGGASILAASRSSAAASTSVGGSTPVYPVILNVYSLSNTSSVNQQTPVVHLHNVDTAVRRSVEEQLPVPQLDKDERRSPIARVEQDIRSSDATDLLNVLEGDDDETIVEPEHLAIDSTAPSPQNKASEQSYIDEASVAVVGESLMIEQVVAASTAIGRNNSAVTNDDESLPSTSGASSVQREEAGTSSSGKINSQKVAEKRKMSNDSASSDTTKISRPDEESQEEMDNFVRPWTCSRPKVAVSCKDYSKTPMTMKLFECFKDEVLTLMDSSMDTEECLPSATIVFKGGAAVFYCNDEESKNRLMQMLREGDFLESRSLKILEDDEIPGCVKMVGIFVNAREPERALKMLGLQNEKLDTARWKVDSLEKKSWGLELSLEMDRRSYEFVKASKFRLPFALDYAFFKGFEDIWNDRCEEFMRISQFIERTAAQHPAEDHWKQLKKYHRSVFTQESKKNERQ